MDETIKATQDIPKESSEGVVGTTSTEEAKTYTEQEKDKAVNDALAAKGRDYKTLANKEADLNARDAAINARQAEIDEKERQRDAAEFEAAKGDPEKFKEYQAKKSYKDQLTDIEKSKRELKKQQDELTRDKAEHEAVIRASQETKMEVELWKVAEAEKVDATQLKEAMKDLNLTTVEQAQALAKRLSKAPAPVVPTPDSLAGGGSVKTDQQSLDERYPSMKK